MPSVTKAMFSDSFLRGTTMESHGASEASGAAGGGSIGSVSDAMVHLYSGGAPGLNAKVLCGRCGLNEARIGARFEQQGHTVERAGRAVVGVVG